MRKRFNIILVTIFIFVSIFMGSPQSAFADSEKPQKVREVVELRTENSKTFELDNGQYECEVHASAIHYKDKDGNFKDIKNSIKAADKAGYQYSNSENAWQVYFADDLSNENAVSIQYDDVSVSFSLLGASNSAKVQKSNTLDKKASKYDKELAGDDRSVVYKNAIPSVDLVYTARAFGLKEDIVLRDRSAQNTFNFKLNLKGLKAVDEEGTTYFINEKDEKVFYIAPMFMEDANGEKSDNVMYSLIESGDGYELSVTADKEFLNADDTTYPVIIDPSIPVYGSADTFDTYVACQCSPSSCTCANGLTNYNSGTTLNYLRTGKDSPYGVRRTYIRFNRPSLPAGANYKSAHIELYKSSSAGAINITAYRVTGTWTSSGITWRNKPGYTTTNNSGLAQYLGENWYELDVSYWIQQFYNGTYSDYGFCIKDAVENNVGVWATWRSSDYGGTTYDPVLRIYYYYAHYVPVQVMAEELFRNNNPSDYVTLMNNYVNQASTAFYNTYLVDLDPAAAYNITGMLGSDCPYTLDTDKCSSYCGAYSQCGTTHHKNKDRNWSQLDAISMDQNFRVSFIDFCLCFYDSSDSQHKAAYGCALNDNALVRAFDDNDTIVRTVQHEVSHLFGCHDGVCAPGEKCIMSGGWNLYPIQTGNIWCYNCYQDFDPSLQ